MDIGELDERLQSIVKAQKDTVRQNLSQKGKFSHSYIDQLLMVSDCMAESMDAFRQEIIAYLKKEGN